MEGAFQGLPSFDARIIEVLRHLCDECLCTRGRLTHRHPAIHKLLGLVVVELVKDHR